MLAAGNTDYVAFQVAVPASVTGPVTLTVDVTYNELPPGQVKKSDDLKTKKVTCSGPKGSDTVTATLAVAPPTGAAVIQKTTLASVPRSNPTWTDITFRGTKPGLANFRVTLAPPAGLVVGYPADATSAGLHSASTLGVGEDDYAAVRLDASGLPVGVYSVPLHATYTGGSFDGVLVLTVT